LTEFARAPRRTSTPGTILIVEDEVFIRLALADDLMDAGFVVLQAFNAAEALQVLEASVAVDLLITDIRMPGPMDGLGLATYVRATWPLLKIMFISGNLTDLPADPPADALFEKPYFQAAVIARVRQLLNGSEQGRAAT
jgi:CheY-like chemotaxis protein